MFFATLSLVMLSLQYSLLPKYLHGSAFYKTLSDDPLDSEISIPIECFKDNDSISTIADLAQMLHVDRFWGLDPLPFSMLDYVCKMEKSRQRRTAILELSDQFPTLLEIRTIFSEHAPLVKSITCDSRPDIVDFLIKTMIDTIGIASAAAAKLGQLGYLINLHPYGHHWDELTCSAAAYGGHLNCLTYAHENGCPWDYRTYEEAAIGGHIECIMYAHKNGLEWDSDAPRQAALHNQLECLKYMLDNGCPLNMGITYEAANYGHGECLEYALQMGCAIYPSACVHAARGGHLQCLHILHRYNALWDEEVTATAAEYGHLDCLQFLHEHGCPWDIQVPDYAIENGHTQCLQYAVEHGCPYSDTLLIDAVESSQLSCIQYLVEVAGLRTNDCNVFITAMQRCNYECAKYIIDQKFPFGDFTEHDSSNNLAWSHDIDAGVQDEQLLLSIQYAIMNGWKMNEWFVKYVVNLQEINIEEFKISTHHCLLSIT